MRGCSSGRQPMRCIIPFPPANSSEQLLKRPPILHQVERSSFSVACSKFINAHRVKDGPCDVLGGYRVVCRILCALVAGAEDLAPFDAATGEQDRHTPGPVVAARAAEAPRA